MQDRFCRADGSQQLLADIRQSCSMADSSGLVGHHVGCCGVVAARANSKALRPSNPPIVSCFADNDTNEALRKAKPLARRTLLSGSCRLVQKAAFDADARHRQTRLTHGEQGGHSQCSGGQGSKPPRAREHLPSQRSPLALRAPASCTSKISDQIIIAPRAERFRTPEWLCSDRSSSGVSPSPSDAKRRRRCRLLVTARSAGDDAIQTVPPRRDSIAWLRSQ